MPSPRISFVSLLLAPLALLSAACVHTGGHPAAAAATPAAPAPVASPPAAASAASPPPSPAAPDFANPPAASSASPANGRPGAAASSAGSGAARSAPAKQPAPKTPAAQRPQPPAAAPSAPAAATAAAAKPATPAAAALDLNGLEQRLRDTRAIGVFTKLSLKNQVDDLLTEFRTYHQGRTPPTLMQLRQQYEVLLMKVVTLLQDGDPSLAGAVGSSREAIWGVLTDPVKFANI